MKIEIRDEHFDPFQELARYQDALTVSQGRYGAAASFIGAMRDHNEGERVQRMILEHYPGMTEREIRRLVEEALDRWKLLDALVIHRVGELLPGDPIVLVAVWSTHRAAAFEACRHIMEALKSRAPFWKKEILPGSQRWVEKNTAGYLS